MERQHYFGEICMPRRTFIKEHHNLLNVLTHGSKAERMAEASEQAAELKAMTGRSGKKKKQN